MADPASNRLLEIFNSLSQPEKDEVIEGALRRKQSESNVAEKTLSDLNASAKSSSLLDDPETFDFLKKAEELKEIKGNLENKRYLERTGGTLKSFQDSDVKLKEKAMLLAGGGELLKFLNRQALINKLG